MPIGSKDRRGMLMQRESMSGTCSQANFFYLCRPILIASMKKDLHPKNYRFVVFKDISNDYAFLSKSTVESKETIKWEDGNDYPLVKLDISHMSHPFYTGKMKLVDTAGRVDKFRTRYEKAKKPASK
jgi:large subunit ribosomal protein L31